MTEVSVLKPQKYALLTCSYLNSKSAVTAQNDELKGSLHTSCLCSLNKTHPRNSRLASILAEEIVQCVCRKRQLLHGHGDVFFFCRVGQLHTQGDQYCPRRRRRQSRVRDWRHAKNPDGRAENCSRVRTPASRGLHPRMINVKFPLQPQQKYYITQCGELGFL